MREAPLGIAAIFAEHRRVLDESAETLPPVLERAATLLGDALRAGGRILVCGNGGSAADAQHFAAELVGRFEADRAALPAHALTTDSSALTAIANDHGFEAVFARQVEAFARPGDVLVAISTSGRSPNVLAAARAARERGCAVVALTGRGGGLLAEAADLLVAAPSENVARVQEVHGLCLHALAHAIERSVSR